MDEKELSELALLAESLTGNHVTDVELLVSHLVQFVQPYDISKNMAEPWILRLTMLEAFKVMSLDYVRTVVDQLARIARKRELPTPVISDAPAGSKQRLYEIYSQMARLRFDLKFDQLETLTKSSKREFPHDSLILANSAFAAMGIGFDGQEAEDRLMDTLSSPGRDKTTISVLVHALTFAIYLPRQEQIQDRLINEIEDIDSALCLWRATVLRYNNMLPEALRVIRRAFDIHDGCPFMYLEISREHQMILNEIAHKR